MKHILCSLLSLTLAVNLFSEGSPGPPSAAAAFLKNPQVGKLTFKGAGNLYAGHYGLLRVGEQGGAIVAIDTGDRGIFKPMKAGAVVADLGAKVAGALGAKPACRAPTPTLVACLGAIGAAQRAASAVVF